MKNMTLLVVGISTALASSALGDKPAKPAMAAKADSSAKMAKGNKPTQMSCEEFLSLDEVTKPKLVYWAQGYDRKGKPEDATFDIETTDRVVPVIVEVCRKEPKESFWKKVKGEFKKVF